MKKIFIILVALLLTISTTFAGGASLKQTESGLKQYSWWSALIIKLDSIIEELPQRSLKVLFDKTYVKQKEYESIAIQDTKTVFYSAILRYANIKAHYEMNPELYNLDNWEKVSLNTPKKETVSCPDQETYQYQSWLDNGWVIPNICDALLVDGIYTWQNHSNGQVAREIPILDGRYNGEAIWYYENGQIQVQGTYDYGKIVWDYYWYNESGNLKQRNTYKENNIIEVTKYFLGYPEEKVGEKYTTKNQKYYGDFTQYYTNGNIHSFTTYSNWATTSKTTYYYKNWEILAEYWVNWEIIMKRDDLKVQMGDTIVYNYLVYDVATWEIVSASKFPEEEIVDDTMLIPLAQDYIIQTPVWGVIDYTLEKYFQDTAHSLYNKDLKFVITVFEIERPKN